MIYILFKIKAQFFPNSCSRYNNYKPAIFRFTFRSRYDSNGWSFLHNP